MAKNVSNPWAVRAIQLDLARQRETVETIQEFIRFSKKCGYNTILLYLEGVIRTESFPCRPAELSYSPDDIRAVVKVANDVGMDIVPCVSTIGHCEYFTRCPELGHLCEDLQHAPMMFCPSNAAVYDFLERYLSEIAELFPSRNFHIGCDEADELGYCPACRQHGREELMVAHISKVHQIMTRLGKRCWIWDDMFENASVEQIGKLPRDIVMCAWKYRSEFMDLDGTQGHFNNLRRRDWFAIYESLGFDMLICPGATDIENILAYTHVAQGRQVLGGLLTTWEMSRCFLPLAYPGTAICGRLWSNPQQDPQAVVSKALRKLLPTLNETARQAIRNALIMPLWEVWRPLHYYMRGPLTMAEARFLQDQILIEKILDEQLKELSPGLEYDITEEFLLQARHQRVIGQLREALPRHVDPRLPDAQKDIDACFSQLQTLARQRSRQWKRLRPGIAPNFATKGLQDMETQLRNFVAGKKPFNLMLQVRLFLWEGYSLPKLRLSLRTQSGVWRDVYEGAFKPVDLQLCGQYTLQVPLRWTGESPDGIRITVSGCGGQGVSFIAAYQAKRALVPGELLRQQGAVTDPQALIKDDSTVCFLGSVDTVETVTQQTRAKESMVEFSLIERNSRV